MGVRVVVPSLGGPEVLRVEEVPPPTPGKGAVLIRAEAAGVAFADVLMRQGRYPQTPKRPFTPGYDVVGVVTALGDGVSGVSVGDRVAAMTVTGGYATDVVAPAKWTVAAPADVDAAAATRARPQLRDRVAAAAPRRQRAPRRVDPRAGRGRRGGIGADGVGRFGRPDGVRDGLGRSASRPGLARGDGGRGRVRGPGAGGTRPSTPSVVRASPAVGRRPGGPASSGRTGSASRSTRASAASAGSPATAWRSAGP